MLQLAAKSADVRKARRSATRDAAPSSLEGRRTAGEPAYRNSARDANSGQTSRRATNAT
jgi:hypothetical protein